MFLDWHIWKVVIKQLPCQVLCFISPFHIIPTTTMLNEDSHFIGKQAEIHKNSNLALQWPHWVRLDIRVWLIQVLLFLYRQSFENGQNGDYIVVSAEILMCTNNPQKFLSFYVWWYNINQWVLQAIYPWEG